MEKIFVTKTYLPPLEEYENYLQTIWQSGQITNQGPLLKDLEAKLQNYLKITKLHFVTNGTLALQAALRALDITDGEIITTPFSYVASTSAILWEKCDPVFIDINPETFCIDVDKIEDAITKKTKAIMPVHVFGNACNVEKIQSIANKHNLKVVYDAAHAFAVEYKAKSLLSYGDISTCSFHATKLFHTIEGGAIVANDKKLSDRVELIKRFGHNVDDHFMLGINAKASEFQAAMGLCMLNHIDEIISQRKTAWETYDRLVDVKIRRIKISPDTKYNYSYFPLVMESEENLLSTIAALNKSNIFPRRYFYPSLNKLPYLKSDYECPESEKLASSVMCLPLYAGLDKSVIEKICSIVNRNVQ
jgi:dTDP-4-amino-4,6-dideoxygalactose transaminase